MALLRIFQCVCVCFPGWQVLLIRLVGCCQAHTNYLPGRAGQPLIFGMRLPAKSRLPRMSPLAKVLHEELEPNPTPQGLPTELFSFRHSLGLRKMLQVPRPQVFVEVQSLPALSCPLSCFVLINGKFVCFLLIHVAGPSVARDTASWGSFCDLIGKRN